MDIIIYFLFSGAAGFASYVIFFRWKNRYRLIESVKKKIKGLTRILVVDDDAVQQDLIRLHLIPEGCRVHVAASRDEALELIHSNTYDLILLDIKLTGENGSSLLKTMRAEGNETSVVIVTGYADPQIYDMSVKFGVPVIEKQHLFAQFNLLSKIFKHA